MKKAILATKVGMTQIFNEDGSLVPVTVLQAGPCVVTQVKTNENDGYEAVQVGFAEKKERTVNKDKNGNKEYVFGYEESYGYLAGTHARDKDAVVASYLIAQMAAYYKNQGKDLIEVLEGIYAKYGYYLDCLDNIVLKGKDGAERIKELMEIFRASGKTLLDDVREEKDYAPGIDGLPKENVLKYFFNDGSWIAIRPSGTEPKLKIYYSIRGESFEAAQAKRDAIKSKFDSVLNG